MKKLHLSITVCLLFFNLTGAHQIRANEYIETQDTLDVLELQRLLLMDPRPVIEYRSGVCGRLSLQECITA